MTSINILKSIKHKPAKDFSFLKGHMSDQLSVFVAKTSRKVVGHRTGHCLVTDCYLLL